MEPQHVAEVAVQMGLQHIVVTSVDRDDLPDGGARQFVRVIEAIRKAAPATTIEILTPDFRNKADAAVEMIVAARPDVYNHNLETVPRSEEHTSELQSLMRNSYAVFCLKKKNKEQTHNTTQP